MKYIFDVDGTISFDGKSIDPRIIQSIKELPGNPQDIIFASARPIRDLLPIVGDLATGPLIGGNGAIISLNGEVKIMEPITNRDFQIIREVINSVDVDYIVDGKWNYSARVSQDSFILRQLDPNHLAHKVALATINQVIKVILLNLTEEQQDDIATTLKKQTNLAIIKDSREHNLDLTAQGVNKYTTLRQLFPSEKYIAFGNDANDTELLAHADKSVWFGDKLPLEEQQPDFQYTANVASVVEAISRIGSLMAG